MAASHPRSETKLVFLLCEGFRITFFFQYSIIIEELISLQKLQLRCMNSFKSVRYIWGYSDHCGATVGRQNGSKHHPRSETELVFLLLFTVTDSITKSFLKGLLCYRANYMVDCRKAAASMLKEIVLQKRHWFAVNLLKATAEVYLPHKYIIWSQGHQMQCSPR